MFVIYVTASKKHLEKFQNVLKNSGKLEGSGPKKTPHPPEFKGLIGGDYLRHLGRPLTDSARRLFRF